MENLFRVVQKIEMKTYNLVLDKHDIQDLVMFSMKVIDKNEAKLLSHDNYTEINLHIKIFGCALIQIIQKIASKKLRVSKKKIGTCKITLSVVEYYALRELINQASFEEMPLLHDILVQLDTQ